jgi:hypothetical protein
MEGKEGEKGGKKKLLVVFSSFFRQTLCQKTYKELKQNDLKPEILVFT